MAGEEVVEELLSHKGLSIPEVSAVQSLAEGMVSKSGGALDLCFSGELSLFLRSVSCCKSSSGERGCGGEVGE